MDWRVQQDATIQYIVTCSDTWCTMLQVILTPTCPVSGYPLQVIEVDAALGQLRFICTPLPTVITLITIIPLGTYNTTSWYIFLWDDATLLVHLSSLMTAVCLSLLTRLLHWTASFTGLLPFLLCFPFTTLPFTTLLPFPTLPFTTVLLLLCFVLLLSTFHWLLSFYNFGLTG
jgi:hypothetical protein